MARVVSGGDQRVVTVTFGDEEQTIQVPPSAPIATFAPSPGRPLNVGMKLVIFAEDSGDAISGQLVGIHDHGTKPPL
ncbi:MAG: hypothetical protein AAF371_06015 [Pseudomonadota bacterium]